MINFVFCTIQCVMKKLYKHVLNQQKQIAFIDLTSNWMSSVLFFFFSVCLVFGFLLIQVGRLELAFVIILGVLGGNLWDSNLYRWKAGLWQKSSLLHVPHPNSGSGNIGSRVGGGGGGGRCGQAIWLSSTESKTKRSSLSTKDVV